MVNTLLMVNITAICNSLLEDKSTLFTHFYLMQGKKWKPDLSLQQAENILALNSQLSCQQIDKKTPFGKMNC